MITVDRLSLQVGGFSLSDVSFTVPDGHYGILMGRTGCGKTTVLEAICGLRRIRCGRILLKGRDVTPLRPAERNLGYVPQDGALFSTLTVREHLAFALRVRRAAREMIAERIEEMSSLLGIGHLLDRKPQGLSGGEAQRVALGRALASHPAILCLDEPMSAVDETTRHELYELLKSIQQRTHVTVLHVTHSPSEAERLGECIFMFENGRIKQV